MLAGKWTAYALSGSTAIFADALESVVHGAATGLAAYSVWYARRPADSEHPYGHTRISYFSAGFEGALVFAAALAIFWSAARDLLYGVQHGQLGVALTIAASLAAINLVLGTMLVRVGRRYRSLVLVANGRHVLADVWTTAAAILGLGLVALTGVEWLDPAAALFVGVFVMVGGVQLVRESVAGLMDRVDPALLSRLAGVLDAQVAAGRIRDHHQLRVRKTDDVVWIEVHVLLPGDLPTRVAHAHVTALEQALRAALTEHTVQITTHIEPADHAQAHPEGHPGVKAPLDATSDPS